MVIRIEYFDLMINRFSILRDFMSQFGCLLLLLVSITPGFSQTTKLPDQQQEAIRWLERMALALEQLSYEGTFVYRQGDQLQSMAVVHLRDKQGIKERLYSLDGDTREIRRNGNVIEANLADEAIASAIGYVQFARITSTEMLRHNKAYRFELGGRKRIASNIAQLVRVIPRDRLRYGYNYWLEVRTGMLLKQSMSDHEGKLLEEIAFASINMATDIPESRLQPRARSDAETVQNRAQVSNQQQRNVTESSWVPLTLPRYFELRNHQQTATVGDMPLDHLLYSDGVAHVSVYIEPVSQNTPDAELAAGQAGVVNIYNRMIDNHRITAVGVVPYETLRVLAGSIMHRDDLGALR